VRICSSPAEYRRPPDTYTVNATYGKTGFEVADPTRYRASSRNPAT